MFDKVPQNKKNIKPYQSHNKNIVIILHIHFLCPSSSNPQHFYWQHVVNEPVSVSFKQSLIRPTNVQWKFLVTNQVFMFSSLFSSSQERAATIAASANNNNNNNTGDTRLGSNKNDRSSSYHKSKYRLSDIWFDLDYRTFWEPTVIWFNLYKIVVLHGALVTHPKS